MHISSTASTLRFRIEAARAIQHASIANVGECVQASNASTNVSARIMVSAPWWLPYLAPAQSNGYTSSSESWGDTGNSELNFCCPKLPLEGFESDRIAARPHVSTLKCTLSGCMNDVHRQAQGTRVEHLPGRAKIRCREGFARPLTIVSGTSGRDVSVLHLGPFFSGSLILTTVDGAADALRQAGVAPAGASCPAECLASKEWRWHSLRSLTVVDGAADALRQVGVALAAAGVHFACQHEHNARALVPHARPEVRRRARQRRLRRVRQLRSRLACV